MNRIKKGFAGGKALIAFVTAGDPSLDVTERLVPAMAEVGADIIELGIPFSDPVAEGEVIQRADGRALSAGATTDRIFETVERIRQTSDVPLAFMTYVNPVFVYGPEKFMEKCARCGIDALIVPDLPFEEKEELSPFCKKYGVPLISLVAPTSKERISQIAASAEGFLYCVSSLGVTGVRENIDTDIAEMVRLAKAEKDIPCAVGFGISSPEQARKMSRAADGVIVGSAIVKLVEKYGPDCPEHVCGYIKELKEAISGE